jgi:hypothetical protein
MRGLLMFRSVQEAKLLEFGAVDYGKNDECSSA